MSRENNDAKKKTERTYSKRERARLATAAHEAATHLATADASTMEAARIIGRTFEAFDGLTYRAWIGMMEAADAAILTESRVSQYRSAYGMESVMGAPLASERQARDLKSALKAKGIDTDDAQACRKAVAADGVGAFIAEAKASKASSKPTPSKSAPKSDEPKSTPKSIEDPAAAMDDAIGACIAAARGNRATLALMRDALLARAKGIEAALAKATAPVEGKARKVTAKA